MNNQLSEEDVSEKTSAPILNEVDQRLQAWARWSTSGSRLGVGFPPCSQEYRLMTEGHVERYAGIKPLSVFQEEEEIEYYIREMALQQKMIAKVIRAHYIDKGTIHQKSRYLGVSDAQFKIYLLICRWWLAGRLMGREKWVR
jgi:hypothetical protein